MSQSGDYERSGGGSSIPDVRTLTGNTGNTVLPDSSGDIKVVGTGIVSVEGSASTHTLKISSSAAKDATTTQKGIVQLSTDAETIAGTNSTKAVVPSSLKAKLGDQTDHAILIAKGSDKKFEYETLNDGELLMGATGKDPKGGNLVSSNATILFTTGENSLNLKVGDRVPTSVGVDGGDSAIPTGNQFKILGGANCSTSASGADVTIDVSHPSSQDATTTQKGVVRLSTNDESKIGTATGAIAVTPTSLKYKLGDQTNHGIAYGKGTGEKIQWTTGLADGQIVIGDTDGTPKAANVTSSNSTLIITKGSNTLDLKAAPSIPTKVATESGTAIPRNNQMAISGGKGIATSALGENVIVKIGSSVPDQFTGDAGSGAVPVGSILQVKGGTNCNTVATGNTITINATGGGGGGGGGSELTVDTDGSPATSSSHVLKVKGANSLVQTSGSGNEVTLTPASSIVSAVTTDAGNAIITDNSLEVAGSVHIETEIDSTKSNRVVINADEKLVSTIQAADGHTIHGMNYGINMLGGIDCTTRKGASDKDLVIDMTGGNRSLEFGDTKSPEGIAKPVSNKIEMHGDSGVDVTASGDRVRFSVMGNVPTSIITDSGSAAPSGNTFEIQGGSDIHTSASGNVITIAYTGGGGGGGGEGALIFRTDNGTINAVNDSIGIRGDPNEEKKSIETEGSGNTLTVKRTKPYGPFIIHTDRGDVSALSGGNNFWGSSGLLTQAEGTPDNDPTITIALEEKSWLIQSSSLLSLTFPKGDYGFSPILFIGNSDGTRQKILMPDGGAPDSGAEYTFVSINSTTPGFEIYPRNRGRIWIKGNSTSEAPYAQEIGSARVESTKVGDVLKLLWIGGQQWQALESIGDFNLY